MRVHELAKELDLPSKEIIDKLKRLGADVKNHMSGIDDEHVKALRQSLHPPKAAHAAPAAPKAKAHAEKPAAPAQAPAQAAAPAPRAAPEAARPHPTKTPARAPEPPAQKAHAVKAHAAPPKARETAHPAKPAVAPKKQTAEPRVVNLRGALVVKELAELLEMRPNQLIQEMMSKNIFASMNERVDFKVAQQIAADHGVTLEHGKKPTEQHPIPKPWDEEEEEPDRPEDRKSRPPVVTLLGHVDHGKTSLLDRIRHTMVAKGEAGGITQHIGAYCIEVNGHKITFLDTPGHAAFTAMRARGANMTDIALLIVAADDGIMAQTEEAIQHAKAANATLMVAINKIDLPTANQLRVKQQLQSLGLTSEEWGGDTICCPVSAATGAGIPELLNMILLQSEMLDLKANPARRATGYVVEARLESGMGPTATLLIKEGTLKIGDPVLCGPHWGKVKALIDDRGNQIKEAGPSIPVKCLGLSGVPDAGAQFRVCTGDKIARTLAERTVAQLRLERVAAPKRASLDNLFDELKQRDQLELRLVLKTDVQGSLEAIQHGLGGIPTDKVSVNIILSGVGNISANDVLLASASKAVVVGFNVSTDTEVNAIARKEGVEIRLYSIIYELIDEIRNFMTGLLAPVFAETVIGHAQVQQVFPISKLGNIAGCMLADGRAASRARARVKRANGVIYEGSVIGLRRFQNDVSEVKEGQECGVRLDNFGAFQKDDVIEFYELKKVAQTV